MTRLVEIEHCRQCRYSGWWEGEGFYCRHPREVDERMVGWSKIPGWCPLEKKDKNVCGGQSLSKTYLNGLNFWLGYYILMGLENVAWL